MKANNLRVLSKNDIKQIHEASLKILNESGLLIESRRVLELLENNGCEVDYEQEIAKFPPDLVEKCLDMVPAKIDIYNRDQEKAFTLGSGNSYFASGHNAVYVIDNEKGERRDSTLKDVEEFTVISDYLDDIDMVGVPVMPQDVEARTTLIYAVKAIIENTKKPIFFSSEDMNVNKAIIELGKVIGDEKSVSGTPMLISQLSTTSPLYWEKGAVEALYEVASAGVPCTFLPQPFTGVTSPYTLAGILTLHNVEVLSGIVIGELINPGTPLIYGSAWTTYEMKMNTVIIGRPESALLRIAGAQMTDYYDIVSHTIGPDTDANLHDEQNGWEKMLSDLTARLGNNDLIVNSGMFGTGMTISLEQLVMDNEINRIVKRLAKGFEVNTDTIAADEIIKVGPQGNYLMEENTLNNLQSGEHVELNISNSCIYETWQEEGSPDIVKKARDKVNEYLEKGNQCQLKESKIKELETVIDKYEKIMDIK